MRRVDPPTPCRSGEVTIPPRIFQEMHRALTERQSELVRWHRRHEINVERVAEAAEQAQILERNDRSARQMEMERRELGEIRDALERIKAGGYGICLGCEEPISQARLRAVPTTCYCRTCKEAVDAEDEMERSRR